MSDRRDARSDGRRRAPARRCASSGLQLAAGLRWTPGGRWLLDAQLRWPDVSGVTMEAEDGAGRVSADYAPVTLLVSAGWRW